MVQVSLYRRKKVRNFNHNWKYRNCKYSWTLKQWNVFFINNFDGDINYVIFKYWIILKILNFQSTVFVGVLNFTYLVNHFIWPCLRASVYFDRFALFSIFFVLIGNFLPLQNFRIKTFSNTSCHFSAYFVWSDFFRLIIFTL